MSEFGLWFGGAGNYQVLDKKSIKSRSKASLKSKEAKTYQ
eukprot:COSAG02_NODE_24980_length_672_cov_0.815009_1_plen_39_part_10